MCEVELYIVLLNATAIVLMVLKTGTVKEKGIGSQFFPVLDQFSPGLTGFSGTGSGS